jgi:hypothetical protein
MNQMSQMYPEFSEHGMGQSITPDSAALQKLVTIHHHDQL